MFKKIFQILIIVGLFALAYNYRAELSQKFAPEIRKVREALHLGSSINPCVEPIPYQLGSFDKKFGISKEYFLSALKDAEEVWERPYGKDLFVYGPDDASSDVLKINLIYDYRQAATSKLQDYGITVGSNRTSFEELKAKFDTLKSSYESDQAAYNARVKAFNQSDRTNKQEYDALQAQAKNLNDKAQELNAMVTALNKLINTLNLSVEKYNTTNISRGESFEEGVYSSDGYKSEIDIYEFSNRQKLVRVLAHELGHALGLEHVDDPKAIMYKLNQGENSTLTVADLKELKAKCDAK